MTYPVAHHIARAEDLAERSTSSERILAQVELAIESQVRSLATAASASFDGLPLERWGQDAMPNYRGEHGLLNDRRYLAHKVLVKRDPTITAEDVRVPGSDLFVNWTRVEHLAVLLGTDGHIRVLRARQAFETARMENPGQVPPTSRETLAGLSRYDKDMYEWRANTPGMEGFSADAVARVLVAALDGLERMVERKEAAVSAAEGRLRALTEVVAKHTTVAVPVPVTAAHRR